MSADGAVIRWLAPGEADAFLAWRAEDDYARQLVRAHIADHFAGGRCILVAWTDRRPVGTITLVHRHEDPDLADGAGTGYTEALEVDQGLRRQGLGRRLCMAAESAARARGLSRLTIGVEPDNAPAIALYTALGFVAFKRSTWAWRGREHPLICMHKRLG